jgi:hypothetical protein
MQILFRVNDVLAFVLELIMLGILARWGYTRPDNLPASIALAIGTPLLAALVWGTFAAPKAWITLAPAGVLTVQVLVFGGAAAALAGLGHRGWAAGFLAVVIVNLAVALAARP